MIPNEEMLTKNQFKELNEEQQGISLKDKYRIIN